MFGKVVRDPRSGYDRVERPIRAITYDTVTNPSHASARVLSFLPENMSTFISKNDVNMKLLQESVFVNDNVKIFDNNESIYDYLNKIILETFRSTLPVKFLI